MSLKKILFGLSCEQSSTRLVFDCTLFKQQQKQSNKNQTNTRGLHTTTTANLVHSTPPKDSIAFEHNLISSLLKMSQTNKQRSLKIAVEGNIASGKSSIIRYLQNKFQKTDIGSPIMDNVRVLTDQYSNYKETDVIKCRVNLDTLNEDNKENELANNKLDVTSSRSNVNFKVISEPVNLWRNLNGVNLLELMYTDPKRWAYPFHSYVQLTMLQNHLELAVNNQNHSHHHHATGSPQAPGGHNIAIMERSLFSARYCFAENLHQKEMITPVEYEILDRWFHFMVKNHDCSLDLIFYLRTKPETCLRRLHNRNRVEEVDRINIDYLQSLHCLHELWLGPASSGSSDDGRISYYKPSNVIIIDADQSIDEVYKTIETETRNAITMAI